MKNRITNLLPLACLSFPWATTANASLSSEAFVGHGFYDEGTVNVLDSAISEFGLNVASSASDPDYQFSGSANAYAAYQRLGTYASGTVGETYFPLEEETDRSDWFVTWGEASFSEVLSYGGEFTGYQSKYYLQFTGTLTGSDAFTFIELTHGDRSQTWSFFGEGTYNIPITSETFVHGSFEQTFSLRMFSSFQLYAGDYEDGSSISGTADFGNTLEVIGVDLRDDTGALRTDITITGDSGSNYDVVAIPEPSGSLLLALGSLALLARRR
ncbi:MAG: PEP-CTERM sorting domain-containing protein [Verrucomicrobiota bacterium JB023]|nr:PEP-CTERM sorting domain-containing protein [Verrucomicrobiota bacterium JB023]